MINFGPNGKDIKSDRLTTAAIYIAELSQAETRGFFTGLTGVAIACGYTVAALMGLAFSYTTDLNVQWRTPLGLCLVPSTALLVVLFYAPESPRFLLLKDKPEQAWKIISALHHDSIDENQEFIKEEFLQMRTQLEFDRALDSSWLHLFKKPSYRKRTLMACLVTFLGQSTAVLVAAAYVSSSSLGGDLHVSQRIDADWGFHIGSFTLCCSGLQRQRQPHLTVWLDRRYAHLSLTTHDYCHFSLTNSARFHPGINRWSYVVRPLRSQTIHHAGLRWVYHIAGNSHCHASSLCAHRNQQSRPRLGCSGLVHDRHLLLRRRRGLWWTILYRDLSHPHSRKRRLLLRVCQQRQQSALS